MKVLGRFYVALAAFSLAGCGADFTGLEADAGDVVHLEATPAADAGPNADAGDDAGELKGEDSSVPPFRDAALERDAGDVLEEAAAAPIDASSRGDDDAGEPPPTPDAGRVPCTILSGCPRCENSAEQACCRSDQNCGCAFIAGQCQ